LVYSKEVLSLFKLLVKVMQNLPEKTVLFYNSLPEIAKRRYVALECLEKGRGAKTYFHKLLGCDYKTIAKGIAELNADIDAGIVVPFSGSRKAGGGRAAKSENEVVIAAFLSVLENNTAGTPTADEAKWTYLQQQQIVDLMVLEGVCVSRSVVRKLLRKFGYVKRKSQKKTL
jgi:hypothetical protein